MKIKEGRKRKEEGEKGKGTEWGGTLGKKKKACKRKEGVIGLLPGRKLFFWSLVVPPSLRCFLGP